VTVPAAEFAIDRGEAKMEKTLTLQDIDRRFAASLAKNHRSPAFAIQRMLVICRGSTVGARGDISVKIRATPVQPQHFKQKILLMSHDAACC
jgi:hypothetical protein